MSERQSPEEEKADLVFPKPDPTFVESVAHQIAKPSDPWRVNHVVTYAFSFCMVGALAGPMAVARAFHIDFDKTDWALPLSVFIGLAAGGAIGAVIGALRDMLFRSNP